MNKIGLPLPGTLPAHIRKMLPKDDPQYLDADGKPTAQIRQPAQKSPLATQFEMGWENINGPAFVTELQFNQDRLFRFDYAWLEEKVALELQGGIYLASKGGHVSARGMRSDCDKFNLATSMGWRVLKLATGQINPDNLLLIRGVIERLRTASPAWKAEARRLFLLSDVTGEKRHAEAAKKATI
jgi:hypothetical protein